MERDFIAVRPAGDDQTISFTSTAPVNPPVGATYTPAATATSGLPVSFSISLSNRAESVPAPGPVLSAWSEAARA